MPAHGWNLTDRQVISGAPFIRGSRRDAGAPVDEAVEREQRMAG
jgi:hypothetical protein